MKKVYFTVGPSQVYPSVYKHLSKAIQENILSLNHRGDRFKTLFKESRENLKKLLGIPSGYSIFFVSSGLESMERITEGCVRICSFHVITGSFGRSWVKYATLLGKRVLKLETTPGDGVDLTSLKIPSEAELICLTQNDTSTGIWLPPVEIKKLKAKYPKKLIAVDLVSSAPYVDLDFKCIDAAFFSVQKGFGLPPGLGVLIVSPTALGKTKLLIKNGVSVGSYHNLAALEQFSQRLETPETPNTLNIYLLNEVTKDMLKKGIGKIRKETDEKTKLIYEFFTKHAKFEPFVKKIKFRSPTTLVMDVKGESQELRKRLAAKGFIVGAGYGDYKDQHIRIANFPSHKLADVRKMLKSL